MATAPHHPSRVAVLRCQDHFTIDPAPLVALFRAQSNYDAEVTVRRALEDIAARLDRLQLSRVSGQYDTISGPARRIAGVAGGLGLVDVRAIAEHVAYAAETGCGVALSATLARLERCFDQAVGAVWEYRIHR